MNVLLSKRIVVIRMAVVTNLVKGHVCIRGFQEGVVILVVDWRYIVIPCMHYQKDIFFCILGTTLGTHHWKCIIFLNLKHPFFREKLNYY